MDVTVWTLRLWMKRLNHGLSYYYPSLLRNARQTSTKHASHTLAHPTPALLTRYYTYLLSKHHFNPILSTQTHISNASPRPSQHNKLDNPPRRNLPPTSTQLILHSNLPILHTRHEGPHRPIVPAAIWRPHRLHSFEHVADDKEHFAVLGS